MSGRHSNHTPKIIEKTVSNSVLLWSRCEKVSRHNIELSLRESWRVVAVLGTPQTKKRTPASKKLTIPSTNLLVVDRTEESTLDRPKSASKEAGRPESWFRYGQLPKRKKKRPEWRIAVGFLHDAGWRDSSALRHLEGVPTTIAAVFSFRFNDEWGRMAPASAPFVSSRSLTLVPVSDVVASARSSILSFVGEMVLVLL